MASIQGWTKEWALGCVNSCLAARGSQEAGFTQPRDHSFAQPCMLSYGEGALSIDGSEQTAAVGNETSPSEVGTNFTIPSE